MTKLCFEDDDFGWTHPYSPIYDTHKDENDLSDDLYLLQKGKSDIPVSIAMSCIDSKQVFVDAVSMFVEYGTAIEKRKEHHQETDKI